jgi:hypothetical protein
MPVASSLLASNTTAVEAVASASASVHDLPLAQAVTIASGATRDAAASGTTSQQEALAKMSYARVVSDVNVAPSHPGDATPRLLLVQSTIGDVRALPP